MDNIHLHEDDVQFENHWHFKKVDDNNIMPAIMTKVHTFNIIFNSHETIVAI